VNSERARKAIQFLVAHHTVVDPTLAIFEFFGASTAKPTASFEPGAAKVAPELAAQLNDVGPPSPEAALIDKAFEKDVAIVGALHKAGVPIVAGTDQMVPGHSLHDPGGNDGAGAGDGVGEGSRHGGSGKARGCDFAGRESAGVDSEHSAGKVCDHKWNDV
jgi:hypothetical protein